MNKIQLEHLGICVTNLEKSINWYQSYFGFELVQKFEKPALEMTAATLKLDKFTLELIQPFEPEPAMSDPKTLVQALRRIGTNHFAISTENVVSLYEKLKADQVVFLTELIENRFFFCKDPDGTLIEVRQMK